MFSTAVQFAFQTTGVTAPMTQAWMETFMQTLASAVFAVHLPEAKPEYEDPWVAFLLEHFPDRDRALLLRRHAEERAVLLGLAQASLPVAVRSSTNTRCMAAGELGECTTPHCQLAKVVEELRVHEFASEFDSGQVSQLAEVGAAHNLTAKNFLYGSTYFPTFLRLFQSASMRPLQSSEAPVVVLGSSTGWVPLYASLTFGIHTHGVELLPSRAALASQIAESLGPKEQSLIRLEEGDATKADITKAGAVYMTSLAWDKSLQAAMHDKLAKELSEDTIVVANSFAEEGRFTPLQVNVLPVSWLDQQKFVLYRKRKTTDTPGAGDLVQDVKLPAELVPVGRSYSVCMSVLLALVEQMLNEARLLDLAVKHPDVSSKEKEAVVTQFAPLTAALVEGLSQVAYAHVGRHSEAMSGAEEDPEDALVRSRLGASIVGLCTKRMVETFTMKEYLKEELAAMLAKDPAWAKCFATLEALEGSGGVMVTELWGGMGKHRVASRN